MANLREAFGTKPWLWLLPTLASGPTVQHSDEDWKAEAGDEAFDIS
jgi:hypothetical protein